MPDDDRFWCSKCLSPLSVANTEEESCPRCDAPIASESDYLTAKQFLARQEADAREWEGASKDGLIVPRTGEAQA